MRSAAVGGVVESPRSIATRATALAIFTETSRIDDSGGKSSPDASASFDTVSASVRAAAANISSVTRRAPLAITLIGGMLLSTVLTLVVIPCVYVVFDRSK